MPPESTVTLLGGYVDESGALAHDVVLRGLAGRDQEWLFALPASTTRARATSELLWRSVKRVGRRRPTREGLATLTLGERDYLLLKLYELSFGSHLELVASCPAAACGAKLDVDVPLESLALEGPPRRERYPFPAEASGRPRLWFRLPTVADELTAMNASELLQTCVVDGVSVRELPHEVASVLEQAIEQASPRLPSAFDTSCAECGQPFALPFDPGALLLGALFRGRPSFERDVHLLSFHYHWPLREILALTPARRAHYVRLLGSELGVA
jgi:hypothetical protein